MKIPQIIFKYSWIYDEHWEKIYQNQIGPYPTKETLENYLEIIKPLWDKVKTEVLTEMAQVTGMNWEEDKIICYLIGYGKPFSDPLTMPAHKDRPDYFIDTLIHELIHQLFSGPQNRQKFLKYWDILDKKFPNQSPTTKSHIPIHAVHTHIYLTVFDETRLKRDQEVLKDLDDYRKSWQIVEQEGYQNIINQLKHIVASK